MSVTTTEDNQPTLPSLDNVAHPATGATMNTQTPANIEALYDITVNVSIVVGQRQMKLKEVINLAKDNIVELDKMAGDPLDIMVNGSLVAHGEIVVANEKYGIRVTEIATKNERINSINK